MKRYQGKGILFTGYAFLISGDEEKLYHRLKKVIGFTKLIGTGIELVIMDEATVRFFPKFGKKEQLEGVIENDKVVVTQELLQGHEDLTENKGIREYIEYSAGER